MPRIKICKELGCHNAQTTAGYCRLHYLKNWKRIKTEQKERAAKRLNRYIDSICRKHPDRYIEAIKEDLRSKHFPRRIGDEFSDLDDIYRLFNDPSYEEEVERLVRGLRIEKE